MIWLTLMLIGLTGCISRPSLPLIEVDIKQPANAHAWELTGKIAFKSDKDKVSANLYWLHSPTVDEMRLTSMLGTGLMAMTVTPIQTQLTLDGNTYTDSDPEVLLKRLSGLSIPVTHLPRWLSGQYQNAQVVTRNKQGQPTKILSTPWTIEVRSWHSDNRHIPKLVQVSRPGVKLKVQINHWQALAPATTLEDNVTHHTHH